MLTTHPMSSGRIAEAVINTMTAEHCVDLSVVLPAYNERDQIASAIGYYHEALERLGRSYEIVVVDDASTDETWHIVRACAGGMPQLKVLRNTIRQGQVGALLHGFRKAAGKTITHNGVDLPFDPRQTERLMACIEEGADVVVVQRENRCGYGFIRKCVSWGNVLLLRTLCRSSIVDHNFVQAFRREVLERVPVETLGVSTVTAELILKAATLGYKIQTTRAQYGRRRCGKSSVGIRLVLRSIVQVVKLAVVMRRWRALVRTGVTFGTQGRIGIRSPDRAIV